MHQPDDFGTIQKQQDKSFKKENFLKHQKEFKTSMKKTFNTNISGILFHIEEDGYDTLRQYLDAITAHFSSYSDNQEIIADIEARIAEIFLSNLKNNKQVITAQNVDKLIEKMGTIADFESPKKEMGALEEEDTFRKEEDPYKYVTPPNSKQSGYKKLVRLENRKILSGVCAGIAHHFSIDPLWTRLVAILLLFSGDLKFNLNRLMMFGSSDFKITLSFGVFVAIAYLILWVILPVSYEKIEDKDVKNLFRDPDDKVLGGVASGLAAYLNLGVIWIRFAFILLILAGGSGLLIYLILWIITPIASSITERIKMKGGEITLDNIDSTLKENLNLTPPSPSSSNQIFLTPFRWLGQVIESIGKALGPLGIFIVSVLRVLIGLAILIFGLTWTIAPIFGFIIYLGVMNSENYLLLKQAFPIDLFSNLVPYWLVMAICLLIAVPSFMLTMLGLSVIAGRNLIHKNFAFMALATWLLSLGVGAFQIPEILVQFKTDNNHIVNTVIPTTNGTLILKINPESEETNFNQANLKIEGSADTLIRLKSEFFSNGKTKSDALINAQKIGYTYSVMDSIINFDPEFNLSEAQIFRNQHVNLLLQIPYNRPFIMERSLLSILKNTLSPNGYSSTYISSRSVWAFNELGLLCLNCPTGEDEGFYDDQNKEDTFRAKTEKIKRDSLTKTKFKDAYFMKD